MKNGNFKIFFYSFTHKDLNQFSRFPKLDFSTRLRKNEHKGRGRQGSPLCEIPRRRLIFEALLGLKKSAEVSIRKMDSRFRGNDKYKPKGRESPWPDSRDS
jgi:hypothetical protein